ncbi:MAG TPA: hypothetical protein VF178_03040, partial [Gemmatimonadaceae bacterium]
TKRGTTRTSSRLRPDSGQCVLGCPSNEKVCDSIIAVPEKLERVEVVLYAKLVCRDGLHLQITSASEDKPQVIVLQSNFDRITDQGAHVPAYIPGQRTRRHIGRWDPLGQRTEIARPEVCDQAALTVLLHNEREVYESIRQFGAATWNALARNPDDLVSDDRSSGQFLSGGSQQNRSRFPECSARGELLQHRAYVFESSPLRAEGVEPDRVLLEERRTGARALRPEAFVITRQERQCALAERSAIAAGCGWDEAVAGGLG